MKVLYAIQTTGSGHISRAKEFIPLLERRFQFDVILSGPPVQLDLGHPVKKHYRGLTLYTYKNGGINWIKTLFKNNLWQLFRDIVKLRVVENRNFNFRKFSSVYFQGIKTSVLEGF